MEEPFSIAVTPDWIFCSKNLDLLDEVIFRYPTRICWDTDLENCISSIIESCVDPELIENPFSELEIKNFRRWVRFVHSHGVKQLVYRFNRQQLQPLFVDNIFFYTDESNMIHFRYLRGDIVTCGPFETYSEAIISALEQVQSSAVLFVPQIIIEEGIPERFSEQIEIIIYPIPVDIDSIELLSAQKCFISDYAHYCGISDHPRLA